MTCRLPSVLRTMSLATILGAMGGCASPFCSYMAPQAHWDYTAQAYSGVPTTLPPPAPQTAARPTTAASLYARIHRVGGEAAPASWGTRPAAEPESGEMVASDTTVRTPADLADLPRGQVRRAPRQTPWVVPAAEHATDESPAGESVQRAAWVPPERVGHLMRTHRIKLNYHVGVPGASAVVAVELWCTEDGHTWTKRADLPPGQRSWVFDAEADGVYGFTVVARRADGLAQRPPEDGDKPQILVEVDQTRPRVQILGTAWAGTAEEPAFRVSWKASDRNLTGRPVSMSYGDGEAGPWHVVARGLPAAGTYLWKLPPNMPERLILRVAALDGAGNVGATQMSLTSTVGGIVPSAEMTGVEEAPGGPDNSLSDTVSSRFPSGSRGRYR
jgi:hypothetical protein